MKKAKRVLAVIGIAFLVSLYGATLICAFTDNAGTMRMFTASVVATVVIPTLIWIYAFIYRLLKDRYGKNEDETDRQA